MSAANSPIVITGGAQRLGLAAARALHTGDTPVVITYRSERPLLTEMRSAGIETIHADFNEPDGIDKFCDALRARFTSLRAIIHNASEWIAEDGEIDDTELLERMYRVHVAAPYLVNRRCGDLLRRYGEQNDYADIFARRPQVQERLTQQVLIALQTLLGTDDVAVTIDATHYCVKARGVMDANSRTQTTALGGLFKDSHKMRAEFLAK